MGNIPGKVKPVNTILDRILGALAAIVLGPALGMSVVAAANFSFGLISVIGTIFTATIGTAIVGMLYPKLTGHWIYIASLFQEDGDLDDDHPNSLQFAAAASAVGIIVMVIGAIIRSQALFFAGLAMMVPFAVLGYRYDVSSRTNSGKQLGNNANVRWRIRR